jgi:hypothetical protein
MIYIDSIPEEFTGKLKDYEGRNIHREDGPAIEYPNGDKEWYRNGNLHREDGPAVIYNSGNVLWCLNNQIYYFKAFLKQLPVDQAMLVALEWL